jgi:hypothetical protein
MVPSTPDLNVEKKPLPEAADHAYFVFASMSVVVQETPPEGLYVAGKVAKSRYLPEGEVMGEGPIGAAGGAPGWLELMDQGFHGAQTSRPPFPPYIEGVMTNDQGFVPSSRQVHY